MRRERLTGLLVCSSASGRPVSPCWDPWPPVYDFQVKPDRSIEPPAEPLPARWNLDTIWGQSASPTPAPDDATRLQALQTVPYYAQLGKTVGFPQLPPVPLTIASVTTIRPAEYDGTFIPSNSVRTVLPPNAADELNVIGADQQTGILPWDVIVPTPSTSVPAPDRLMIDDSNALAIDINGNRILVE